MHTESKYGAEYEKEQRENFQKVIELCEKIKKPLIVHTRKAERPCVEMLQSSNVKHVVLHCFEGRKNLIKQAADAGMIFSVPTNITRLQHFQMLVEIADLSQITTETDAPWLGPTPMQRNEPANVLLAVKKIAEIKNMTAEEVANNIYLNYQRIYE